MEEKYFKLKIPTNIIIINLNFLIIFYQNNIFRVIFKEIKFLFSLSLKNFQVSDKNYTYVEKKNYDNYI